MPDLDFTDAPRLPHSARLNPLATARAIFRYCQKEIHKQSVLSLCLSLIQIFEGMNHTKENYDLFQW
jgi:hypothetical protein